MLIFTNVTQPKAKHWRSNNIHSNTCIEKLFNLPSHYALFMSPREETHDFFESNSKKEVQHGDP